MQCRHVHTSMATLEVSSQPTTPPDVLHGVRAGLLLPHAGAMFLAATLATLVVSGSNITFNTAAAFGGAVLVTTLANAYITNGSRLNNNSLFSDSNRFGGGALYIQVALTGTIAVSGGSQLDGNSAGLGSGGAILAGGNMGGVHFSGNSSMSYNTAGMRTYVGCGAGLVQRHRGKRRVLLLLVVPEGCIALCMCGHAPVSPPAA